MKLRNTKYTSQNEKVSQNVHHIVCLNESVQKCPSHFVSEIEIAGLVDMCHSDLFAQSVFRRVSHQFKRTLYHQFLSVHDVMTKAELFDPVVEMEIDHCRCGH